VLRDELALTGAKKGCNTGTCGACNVLVDDVMIRSCLRLAVSVAECKSRPWKDGAQRQASAVQQAFLDAGAIQCGFLHDRDASCPASALARTESGADAATKSGSLISGNLCRCSGLSRWSTPIETGGKPVRQGMQRKLRHGIPH